MKHYFNESYIFNNVWSSSDGKNWSLDTENPGFGPRFGSGVAVYNGTLWVFGGRNENNQANAEVWQMNPPTPDSTPLATVPHTQNIPSMTPVNGPSTTNVEIDPLFLFIGIAAGFGFAMKIQKKN